MPLKLMHTNGITILAEFPDLDTFVNANLRGLNLRSADLAGLDFSGADFSRSQLNGAYAVGANFTGARFERTVASQAWFHNANFTGSTFVSASFDSVSAPGANFTRADIRDSALSYGDLTDCVFDHALLRYVGFDATNVAGTTFNETVMTGVSGITMCALCRVPVTRSQTLNTFDVGRICRACSTNSRVCNHCGNRFHDISGHDQEHPERFIKNYSYKPVWVPKGKGTVHFGIELEIDCQRSLAREVYRTDPKERHLIMKDDSSISGFEIVSHPMTLNWAKLNFPFELLPKLRAGGARALKSTGLHIHVARSSFTNEAHSMAWLLLIYRNTKAVEALSRRSNENYAAFKTPAKGELAMKAKAHGYWDRHVAVNCNNENTFEVRTFRATLNPHRLAAAMEFMDASVEYTRTLNSKIIIENKALSWPAFYQWVVLHSHRYNALKAEMERTTPDRITVPA